MINIETDFGLTINAKKNEGVYNLDILYFLFFVTLF